MDVCRPPVTRRFSADSTDRGDRFYIMLGLLAINLDFGGGLSDASALIGLGISPSVGCDDAMGLTPVRRSWSER
jgi:hypothetical protein